MHFKIINSRQIHKDRLLLPGSRVCEPKFLTVILKSTIVIVVGVTLVLIDKGEKKNPSSGHAFISDSRYAHAVITACRENLCVFAVCVCVCE